MKPLLSALALTLLPMYATAQSTHLLVVVGLGGDDRHRETFHGWATELIDAAGEGHGVAPTHITYLGEKPEIDPARIQGPSTREGIESAVHGIASVATGADDVLIVLIGHGTARGGESRFNLPGPDMGPTEFGLVLDRLESHQVTFVNTTSSSGGFVELAGPNRTIITATRTSREQNETVFGQFFVQAFTGEAADLDKDGRVSVLEAYEFANHEVERHYADEGLLQTEHPRLVDDWQGQIADLEDTAPEDARLARSTYLRGIAGPNLRASATPELAALYQKRDSLQARVEELRDVRDAMETTEYESRLEDLLVEMGLLAREIRDLEGRP